MRPGHAPRAARAAHVLVPSGEPADREPGVRELLSATTGAGCHLARADAWLLGMDFSDGPECFGGGTCIRKCQGRVRSRFVMVSDIADILAFPWLIFAKGVLRSGDVQSCQAKVL